MTHGWWMVGETIFWVALVVAAVWVATGLRTSSAPAPGGDPALGILEQGFARGEISVTDFEEQRRELIEGGKGR